ncbi:hypothetical protein LBMAG42_19870 [Deltaproteobacteria bacterium]|nr:hypothetical protein LBMAG42_19870 [Deltaproteobacteria bacterium]
MACFVTWEMPLVEENEPPTIFPGGFADGELVEMSEDTTFFVRAQDPDSQEPLLFLWEAGNDALFGEPSQIGEPGEEAGALWYSVVVVAYDPDLDGDTVQCHIYDGDGASVDLAWPVVVL